MKRRTFLGSASLAAALPTFGRAPFAQRSAAKSLRIIRAGNLASLDPIWTTAPPTKDYAYLTFDQLLAVDLNYVPRPQMADGWTVEDDGRTYILGLREGLKFHDGEPVRSADCIASIQRWGARDGFGQLTMKYVDGFEASTTGASRSSSSSRSRCCRRRSASRAPRNASSCPSAWPRPTR